MLHKTPGSEQYSSRVEEINKEHVVFAMPLNKGYPVFLGIGRPFYAKTVCNGVGYRFKCTLLSKKVNPLPIWIASLPAEVEKVQLREFVRIDASLSVAVELMPEETADEAQKEAPPPLQLITKDVSGGGIMVISKQTIPMGTKVKLTVDIPDTGEIQAFGQVVRHDQPQPDLPVYWVGIKFLKIVENDRSKLIKYVFRRQLELHQKGI